jgi:BNR repeat-containing family member
MKVCSKSHFDPDRGTSRPAARDPAWRCHRKPADAIGLQELLRPGTGRGPQNENYWNVWPWICLIQLVLWSAGQSAESVLLNDDGGWSWFQDERALVDEGQLLAGSVAQGRHDPARRGDVEVTVYDFKSAEIHRSTLHQNLESDDHDAPALWVRPDGRILAVYTKHGPENRVYYRISQNPHEASSWGEEGILAPSEKTRVTYSNLHFLAAENSGRGRLYDFFRGYDNSFKPSWMVSDDHGETWRAGGILIEVPSKFRHRPYVKYASDGQGTIHFAFTEGHPRNFDNSIYHAYYRQGRIHRSDGEEICALKNAPFQPRQATRVFQGDSNNVAWIQDLELDEAGRPRLVYSVQKDSAGLPPGQGGQDHRYRFARWDGQRWHDFEIAHAGARLYAGEDDYTGGISLDPDRTDTVFISTQVEPATGAPLVGGHYELFRGATPDGGRSWQWEPLTPGDRMDNLRPIVPKRVGGKTALLWLRGTYRSYTRYDLAVMGQVLPD